VKGLHGDACLLEERTWSQRYIPCRLRFRARENVPRSRTKASGFDGRLLIRPDNYELGDIDHEWDTWLAAPGCCYARRRMTRTTRWARGLVVTFAVATVVIACGDSESDSSGPGCTSSLPAGSYARSCSNCKMSGTVLACECGAGDGTNPPAQLDTCSCESAAKTHTIWNDHGVLKCGDGNTSGSSSSSGGSCKGCTADSDCGSCQRCERSTCTCRTRLSCVGP
jgi:hypothetical protein